MSLASVRGAAAALWLALPLTALAGDELQPVFVPDLAAQGGEVADAALSKLSEFLRAELETSTNLLPFPGEDARLLAQGREVTHHRQQLEADVGELLSKARNDYLNLDFAKSLEGFEQAAAILEEKGRGAEIEKLVEIRLQIANTHLAMARRRKMDAALRGVLELRPDFSIDASEFPPKLIKRARYLRKKIERAKPGSMSVTSEPSVGKVLLDGRAVGETPLLLQDVKPGKHSVCVELADHLTHCSWAPVKSKQKYKLDVHLAKNPAVESYRLLIEQLTEGALRENTVVAAADLGQALQLERVIVGGVGERAGQLVVAVALIDCAGSRLLRRVYGALSPDLSGLGELVPALAAALAQEGAAEPEALTAAGLTVPETVARDFDSYLFGISTLNAPAKPPPETEVITATMDEPGTVAAAITVPDPGTEPEPQPEVTEFYQTWWFWTVVGAVVAGGAVTAGVLLAPGEASQRPNAIDATITINPSP